MPSYKGILQLSSSISAQSLESLVYQKITNELSLTIEQLSDDDCIDVFLKLALYVSDSLQMVECYPLVKSHM